MIISIDTFALFVERIKKYRGVKLAVQNSQINI